jgi:transcriptional regulator of NAD metabolism
MKSMNEPLGRSPQSQTKKVKRRHSSEVDYYSELRDWVQHMILEAEKNKDFKKKEKFLRLLEDL